MLHKNKMLMLGMLLINELLLNHASRRGRPVVCLFQCKPKPPGYFFDLKNCLAAAAASLYFSWLLKKGRLYFSCTNPLMNLLTNCHLKAPPLRHTVWGAADG